MYLLQSLRIISINTKHGANIEWFWINKGGVPKVFTPPSQSTYCQIFHKFCKNRKHDDMEKAIRSNTEFIGGSKKNNNTCLKKYKKEISSVIAKIK